MNIQTLEFILKAVNLILIPVVGYLIWIERRLTRIETILKHNFCDDEKKKND